jgi:hypothetical protein
MLPSTREKEVAMSGGSIMCDEDKPTVSTLVFTESGALEKAEGFRFEDSEDAEGLLDEAGGGDLAVLAQ